MSRTDSLYQQLRSHLAYLKLTAAAEALPAALDHATRTKQNPTEFLHDLLTIEVDATEARRLAGRMRFANFPTPWRIEDFDFAAQPSVDEALVRDLATNHAKHVIWSSHILPEVQKVADAVVVLDQGAFRGRFGLDALAPPDRPDSPSMSRPGMRAPAHSTGAAE